MNPIEKINSFINSASFHTIDTIKKIFFLAVFLLIIISIVLGIKKGKEAASIRGVPLMTNTNQAFDVQLNRERKNHYSSVLDEDRITEPVKKEEKKIMVPSRDTLEPDLDSSVIDNKGFEKIKKTPDIRANDTLIEPDTSTMKEQKRSIDPIDTESKLFNRNESSKTTDLAPSGKSQQPIQKTKTNEKIIRKNEDIRLQLKNNEGLIE